MALEAAHASDCVAVVASLPEWFGYPGAKAGVARAVASEEGFVALEGGGVVGFVSLAPSFEECVEVTYLAVHADHRRQGHGRRLLGAAAARAAELGASALCLLTLGPSAESPHQEETIAFYRSLGLWRTKELELVAWGGAPALVMVAPLERLRLR